MAHAHLSYRLIAAHKGWILIGILILSFALFLTWPLADTGLQEATVTSTRVLDRNGVLLREIRPDGRGIPVALQDVSPHAVEALIATEDRHFYRHIGVNPLAILRAFLDNTRSGDVVSGASTLTMQVARTLRGQRRRTLFQKIAEAMLALRLEAHLTKDDILTLWLNRVYFGNQSYGIEAASRLYFGKSARDLTLAEAAFLVGLPQNPNGYDPYRHLERARTRQRRVLDAMQAADLLTENDAQRHAALPIELVPRDLTFRAPHFVEFVAREQRVDEARPSAIGTTLDAGLQADVEALIRSHLQRLGNDRATNAAAIVLENATGNVLAYAGSADYWNDAIEGRNDGVQMLRQPGSALKPFTYALALGTKRYTAASILPDIELHIPEAGGAFSPANYDKEFHGPVPARTALASSYNVPAVRLLRELGTASLLDLLKSVGIRSLQKDPEHYGVGLTLGNGEVRLIELAQAYATLARGGHSKPVRATNWVLPARQDTFVTPNGRQTPTQLSSEIAYLITDILQDPEARAPAFGRYGPLELPFPTAVKTGTSRDYRDNWTVGYTPTHTVAVWAGNFDGSPMRRVSGVSGAGPLFHAIMLRLGSGGSFEPPPLETALICPISGHRPGSACPGQRRELFLTGTLPRDTCAVHQLVPIDRRDGSRATADTPAEFVEETLFTVHPEIFRPWMQEHRIPLPPDTEISASTMAKEPPLVVHYPESGMIFQIDPVLKTAYQRLHLQATAASGLRRVTWWIDDRPLDAPYDAATWPLSPGEHTFELRAETPDRQTISSHPVSIRVLPPQAE